MAEKRGSLSINSENIFPIIKKWLYSDHDIFYRELISNGCDAITKLKKLEMMGEYEYPADVKKDIHIIVNPEKKTLKFIDTGLGMTAEEVEEYINQIAFPVQPILLRNIRIRQMMIRLSVILDLVFILHLWYLMKCILIRFLTKRAQYLFTGNVMVAQSFL